MEKATSVAIQIPNYNSIQHDENVYNFEMVLFWYVIWKLDHFVHFVDFYSKYFHLCSMY